MVQPTAGIDRPAGIASARNAGLELPTDLPLEKGGTLH